jgi:hypothetical protein
MHPTPSTHSRFVTHYLSESTLSLTAGAQSPFILDIKGTARLSLYDLITTRALPVHSWLVAVSLPEEEQIS